MQCNRMDPIMAKMRRGLANNPMVRRDESSDRALRALNISMMTSTERLSVDAFYLPHEK